MTSPRGSVWEGWHPMGRTPLSRNRERPWGNGRDEELWTASSLCYASPPPWAVWEEMKVDERKVLLFVFSFCSLSLLVIGNKLHSSPWAEYAFSTMVIGEWSLCPLMWALFCCISFPSSVEDGEQENSCPSGWDTVSPQNLLIQAEAVRKYSSICSIWLYLKELPPFHYIFLSANWFATWELLSYYSGCYSIKLELVRFTQLYSNLAVANGRVSYLWWPYSFDSFLFPSYKAVIQSPSFIHDTLKAWRKLNFIASELKYSMHNSCMTLWYFNSKVTVSLGLYYYHCLWSMSLVFLLIEKKIISPCVEKQKIIIPKIHLKMPNCMIWAWW